MRRLFSRELVRRWVNQERRIEAILEDMRRDLDWTARLLANPELGWEELEHLGSCPQKVLGDSEAPRDLRGIVLADEDLSRVGGFADSVLDYACFQGVNFKRSSFNGSSLRHARFRDGTVLDGASFVFANLTGAALRDISIAGADFSESTINSADFRGSRLDFSSFKNVKFTREKALRFIGLGSRPTRFGGEVQRFDRLGRRSSTELVDYAYQQGRISYLERAQPVLSKVSYLLTNYGQSSSRLFLWVVILWLFFATLYFPIRLPDFLVGTQVGDVLVACDPVLIDSETRNEVRSPVRLLYFSAVTLTTLGFGDIVPEEHCVAAEVCAAAEALMGYALLGAFVSLLLHSFVVHRR